MRPYYETVQKRKMGNLPGAEVCQNTRFVGTPVFGRRAKGNGAETKVVSTPFLEVESVEPDYFFSAFTISKPFLKLLSLKTISNCSLPSALATLP